MDLIKEIFDLCLEKGLFFQFSPHVQSITVFDLNQDFYKNSYYDGNLKDNEEGYFVPISKLLSLVKNYNP